MSDELVTIDCDSVTLHEWLPGTDLNHGSLGPQIGERIHTNNTWSVQFRVDTHETKVVHAALWSGATVLLWTEPRRVGFGSIYLVHLPVIGTIS